MDTEFQVCLWVKMLVQADRENNYMMHDALAYIFTFVFTTVSYLCAVTTVQISIFDSCPIIKPSWRGINFSNVPQFPRVDSIPSKARK